MKLTIKLLLVALAILLTSCAEYKVISIQTLKPAELSTPNNFQQPIVVLGLYKGIEGVDESMAQAAIDSIAALEAGFVLAETLYDSPWFQDFSIPVSTHYREDSSHLILPYSWAKVEQLAEEDNADLVISLEYIRVTPEVDSYSYWDGATNAYYGYLSMKIYAYWRVYDLNSKKVTADFLYKDTLVWEENDYSRVRIGNQLPGFFSAASYCGYQTGLEYAKKIAPSWMDERRFYYIRGSKNMRQAVDFADENSWKNAASLWQKVINNPDTKPEVAAKAAFNMALANELNGNFDVALNWLDKSEDFHKLEEIDWYRKILSMRIKVLERL
ncbi:MAG: DUF6340 family protein [Perlabentimonas sp.]